jgi:hypothetical protein
MVVALIGLALRVWAELIEGMWGLRGPLAVGEVRARIIVLMREWTGFSELTFIRFLGLLSG